MHGYVNCGARGAITGIGNVLPREVLHLVALCERRPPATSWLGGGRGSSILRWRSCQATTRGPTSFYYKYLMVLEGNPEYALHFNASDALSAGQRHYAENQLRIFKAWYARWSKEDA